MVRNLANQYFFAVLILAALSTITYSQSDNSDIRSWSDLQITVPITKKIDLYTNATIQFDNNISRIDNTRFAIGVTAKPTKQLSITPFVVFLSDRNSRNQFRYEYRYVLRGVYRWEFEKFALSHRSQIEFRFRPGANTWRYRPSVTFEKPLPKSFVPGLKAFVTEEPFYDSASGRFSRNRFSVGLNKTLNKELSVDVYYLHQGDNASSPGNVNVIGTTLKVKL